MHRPCCARVSSSKPDRWSDKPNAGLAAGPAGQSLRFPARNFLAIFTLWSAPRGRCPELAFFLLTLVDSNQTSYERGRLAPRPSLADGLQSGGHLRFGLEVVDGLRNQEERGRSISSRRVYVENTPNLHISDRTGSALLACSGQRDAPSGGQSSGQLIGTNASSLSTIPATQPAIAPIPGARHGSAATTPAARAGANVHGHDEAANRPVRLS